MIFFLFFGRGRGCGARSPAKADDSRAPVKPILPYNEANENGEQDFFPVPRFRRCNGTAKIQPANGLRVEIFVRKYYPSIDGVDRHSGRFS